MDKNKNGYKAEWGEGTHII